jgi:hypothetical protein
MSITDDMEKCTCWCGCRYGLISKVSLEGKLCFGCRMDLHYGTAKEVPVKDPDKAVLTCSACGQVLA